MPGRDVVVVGASAGGIEALSGLVRRLPADLPASLFVVLHIPPTGTSVLPAILDRAGPLRARAAQDGEPIEHGRIYVAPPDRHLQLQPGAVHVTPGPKENGHRPAIDALFRTAALAYGPRVTGVVLSGLLDDGTAGLRMVKQLGGTAIVQHPEDTLYPSMALSAIENVAVDVVAPLAELAECIDELARRSIEEEVPMTHAGEPRLHVEHDGSLTHDLPGAPSGFTCPDCGGALWELHDGELLRYRCHIGHAYSIDSFRNQQRESLETALWSAFKALKERAALDRRLAARLRARGSERAARRFEDAAATNEDRLTLLWQLLEARDDPIATSEAETANLPGGEGA